MRENNDSLFFAKKILEEKNIDTKTQENILEIFQDPITLAINAKKLWLDGYMPANKIQETADLIHQKIQTIIIELKDKDIFSAHKLKENLPKEHTIKVLGILKLEKIQKIVNTIVYTIFPESIKPENMINAYVGDKYKITEIIHNSENSTIYKSVAIVSNNGEETVKEFVLKSLPLTNTFSEEERSLLEKEYENQRQLCHPNIHNYVEIIQHFETTYLVSEYLRGETFISHLQKNKLDNNKLLFIFLEIADTIDYLHTNKIMHLDINENNIFITKNESIKIIDFGISKQGIPLSTRNGKLIAEVTKKGDFIPGTLPYMSPESFEFNVKDEDEISKIFSSSKTKMTKNADIWSFGIVMYHIIFNEFPFGTNLNEILHNFNNLDKTLQKILKSIKNKEKKQIFKEVFMQVFNSKIEKRPKTCKELYTKLQNIVIKIVKKNKKFTLQENFFRLEHLEFPIESTHIPKNQVTKKNNNSAATFETLQLLKFNEAAKEIKDENEQELTPKTKYNGTFSKEGNYISENLINQVSTNIKFTAHKGFSNEHCCQCISFPKHVKELELIDTEITSDGFSQIGNLPHIKILHLGGNNISPIRILHLKQQTSKQQLEKIIFYEKTMENKIRQEVKDFIEKSFPKTTIIWN